MLLFFYCFVLILSVSVTLKLARCTTKEFEAFFSRIFGAWRFPTKNVWKTYHTSTFRHFLSLSCFTVLTTSKPMLTVSTSVFLHHHTSVTSSEGSYFIAIVEYLVTKCLHRQYTKWFLQLSCFLFNTKQKN